MSKPTASSTTKGTPAAAASTSPGASATSGTSQRTDNSSAPFANLIEQVVRQVTPTILEAAKNIATNASKETQEEMQRWKDLQEERRRRDAETFKYEGNQEQYKHANEVLTEFENIDYHMENKNWAKAKEALEKGKKIVNDRIKLVKLADGSSWGTVKEFRSGTGGVEEGDEKRWKAAQRAVKEKAEAARRENKYRDKKSPILEGATFPI